MPGITGKRQNHDNDNEVFVIFGFVVFVLVGGAALDVFTMTPKQRAYIFAAARKIWRWSAERRAVKARCLLDGAAGVWVCEQCWETTEKIEIDHVEPVIDPAVGFQGFDVYYARLFVGADKMQGLCHECHQNKTKEERKLRRKKND